MADFGKAAEDYARHRQGFPPAFFGRLADLGLGLAGQTLLDLGTGTGLLARAFAEAGCRVTASDASAEMIAAAEQPQGGSAIDYRVAPAEATGLPASAFEVITAGTCWHWFDRPAAAREAFRLLVPGGRLVIAHLDWHRVAGNVIDVTLASIDEHAAKGLAAPTTFQFPAWLGELTAAGFTDFEAFGFSCALTYRQKAWRGRVRASARVGPAMDPETLARFDSSLAGTLAARFPEDPFEVDHRVFALVLSKPGDANPALP